MDLTTSYLGLKLASPLVASASPLAKDADKLKALADAGAGAVVMYSLFEEQIRFEADELDFFLTKGADSYAEALSYYPTGESFQTGPKTYLRHVEAAKAAVGIPVIGSLNGISAGGWIEYAKRIQDAAASNGRRSERRKARSSYRSPI